MQTCAITQLVPTFFLPHLSVFATMSTVHNIQFAQYAQCVQCAQFAQFAQYAQCAGYIGRGVLDSRQVNSTPVCCRGTLPIRIAALLINVPLHAIADQCDHTCIAALTCIYTD